MSRALAITLPRASLAAHGTRDACLLAPRSLAPRVATRAGHPAAGVAAGRGRRGDLSGGRRGLDGALAEGVVAELLGADDDEDRISGRSLVTGHLVCAGFVRGVGPDL